MLEGRMTMDDTQILLGPMPQKHPPAEAGGGYVDLAGERFFRISNVDAMPPFLMSLASDSDHWLFISSTGALTAGRGNPDRALFPYTTDDRIHDARDRVGGKTSSGRCRGPRVARCGNPCRNASRGSTGSRGTSTRTCRGTSSSSRRSTMTWS